jgi:hypothetical protein
MRSASAMTPTFRVLQLADGVDGDAARFHPRAENVDPRAFEFVERRDFLDDRFAEQIDAAGAASAVDQPDDAGGETFLAGTVGAADQESVRQPSALERRFHQFECPLRRIRHGRGCWR